MSGPTGSPDPRESSSKTTSFSDIPLWREISAFGPGGVPVGTVEEPDAEISRQSAEMRDRSRGVVRNAG